jgi:hypothetical protein
MGRLAEGERFELSVQLRTPVSDRQGWKPKLSVVAGPRFEPVLQARKSALRTRSELLAARRQRLLKPVDCLRIKAGMARAKVIGKPPGAAAIKGHDVGSNTVQQIKAELADAIGALEK